MTLFMLTTLVIFFAIVALLWCFRGFSRELQHPRKPIAYVIRLKQVELEPRQPKATTAAKPGVRRAATLQHVSSAASVVSLALLLGSR